MDFWRSRQFKVLSREWEKKLEESGFVDAEKKNKNGLDTFRKSSALEREARLEYYLLVGHLVESTKFENEIESYIMRRHSEGATVKTIAHEVKFRGVSRCRKTVGFIIRRWQMKWGIRRWSHRQMNLRKAIR